MKNIKKIPLIFSILSILTFFTPANAEIKVVASIKPIHSLASYLMDGIAKPDLIVDGYASPHGFAMKPSHAKMLQNADLIFWIGEDLESFLEKPLSSIAKKAEKIELMETKGLQVLKFRERNIFDEHDHDDHGKKEDDHDHDDHGKKEDDHDDHGHDDHDGHAHGEFDPHIWLDPINAKAMLNEMAEHLIENDPKNEAKYKSNLAKALQEIDKLTINVMTDLSNSVSSIVFHDAYQYFENHFNISASGAISLGDASDPSPARLKEIKERVEKEDIHCVLAEPQYNEGLVKAVIEGTHANNAIIDPLGVSLEIGPNLYDKLIRNLAINLSNCF